MNLIDTYIKLAESTRELALHFLIYNKVTENYCYDMTLYQDEKFWDHFTKLLTKRNINFMQGSYVIVLSKEEDKDLSLYILQSLIYFYNIDFLKIARRFIESGKHKRK